MSEKTLPSSSQNRHSQLRNINTFTKEEQNELKNQESNQDLDTPISVENDEKIKSVQRPMLPILKHQMSSILEENSGGMTCKQSKEVVDTVPKNFNSQRSLKKNTNSTPKQRKTNTFTKNMSNLEDDAKILMKKNYVNRLDKIVAEYECGGSKLNNSLEDGYLSFIGFGQNGKKKKRNSFRNKKWFDFETDGHVGWFISTLKAMFWF